MMFQDNYDRIKSLIALVAEDDDATRAHIAEYLRGKGYGVLEAHTSLEALLLAVDFPDRIDALFTSTRLRKYCNGVELAGSLRAARPELALFYMDDSAAPSEVVTRDLVMGNAVLLKKPISTRCLEESLGLIDENRAWPISAADRLERV